MGILLNKSFTNLRIRFPKKDKESQPIKIRKNIDMPGRQAPRRQKK